MRIRASRLALTLFSIAAINAIGPSPIGSQQAVKPFQFSIGSPAWAAPWKPKLTDKKPGRAAQTKPTAVLVPKPVFAPDFKTDVIYQIFTDRFFSGRADNDNPEVSFGMFDPDKKNWGAYWGGDLDGIRKKLQYIKDLGATAIWISPIVDNSNKVVLNAEGKVKAPYHGYHARDFKRLDEHFGDPENSWVDFDRLTSEAHKLGIKVIVDIPFNHTSEINHGEFGSLFDNNEFKGDVENDRDKYFNHGPEIKDYNDRLQLQYGTLAYLGDLRQENEFVNNYLRDSAERHQKHGADATRLDAAKHTTWGWQQTLANLLYNKAPHMVVAEWWMDDVKEPLYRDAMKFANKGGMSLMDFPLAMAIRKVLGAKEGADFSLIDSTIAKEYEDLDDPNGLVTFIDNHDMPRFLSLYNSDDNLNLALSLIFTSRGTPIVYYGTEQHLHDDTKGGGDPYTRAWMSSFDTKAPGYQLVQKLSQVRKSNPAFSYGSQSGLYVSKDVYVFERKFGSNVAIVAINKNDSQSMSVPEISTAASPGFYKDALGGTLKGQSLTVLPDRKAFKFELPPSSVSVWLQKSESVEPLIGSVTPIVINGGAPVTICGLGFGAKRGKLKVGSEDVDVNSWTDDKIQFTAPALLKGQQELAVTTTDGKASTRYKMSFVESKLIAIKFVVKNHQLKPGEELFLTGNVSTLGAGATTWKDAAGPMLWSGDTDYFLSTPMPASQKVEIKLAVLDKDGKVIRQESRPHIYQVPELGVWSEELKWQD